MLKRVQTRSDIIHLRHFQLGKGRGFEMGVVLVGVVLGEGLLYVGQERGHHV